jgi:hypothetical protein
MGRKRSHGAVILLACTLVLGCSYTQRRPITGRDIDPKRVEAIVPQETTKPQLLERFGKPDQVTEKPDGSAELLYDYRGYVEKTQELIVYAKKVTETERKILRVLIKGDVVTEVKYTNSADPAENVSK